MKKLKIGIDIDNVIADTGTMFLERFNKAFDTNMIYEEVEHFSRFTTHSGIDSLKVQQFTDGILNADEFFESVNPYQEALEVINRWSGLGYSIHYISARGTVSERVTKLWLRKHGFYLPDITLDLYDTTIHETEAGYKDKIARRIGLNIMIEDDPEYAKTITVPVLLLDRPWNRGELPGHIKRVKDWKEIEEVVEKNFSI